MWSILTLEKADDMTTATKKALLKKLIEAEQDPAVLDLVDNVLQRRTRDVAFQSDLVRRVLRSEEQFKAGTYKTMDEFDREMEQFMDAIPEQAPKPRRKR
jgi:hypothetical protein